MLQYNIIYASFTDLRDRAGSSLLSKGGGPAARRPADVRLSPA